MDRDLIMRRVLVVAAMFNFAAAAMILFPQSIGRFADVPLSAPHFHSWLLALFIALFGGVYAWLSRRAVIDRPLIGMAVLGKTGVFLVALVCLATGDITARTFATAIGDLAFAAVFLWWLRGPCRADTRPTVSG
jgi:hypothetical protein